MSGGAHIVAVGGGGFTHDADPELEDYPLALLDVAHPRIGFVATASGDDELKIERFYRRFAGAGRTLSHLALFGTAPKASRWVAAQDLIYVGGGNTRSMLAVWREWDLPALLRQASRRGTILAGVSAGAVCWFDAALSDSAGEGLAPLPGLGFVTGSCCPHASDAHRRHRFEEHVASGRLPDGIAIEDGVAVHLRDGVALGRLSARDGAEAWSVQRVADGVEVRALESLLDRVREPIR